MPIKTGFRRKQPTRQRYIFYAWRQQEIGSSANCSSNSWWHSRKEIHKAIYPFWWWHSADLCYKWIEARTRIKSFGNEEATSQTVDVVRLHAKSKNISPDIHITALSVLIICSHVTNKNISFAKQRYVHLQKPRFSRQHSNFCKVRNIQTMNQTQSTTAEYADSLLVSELKVICRVMWNWLKVKLAEVQINAIYTKIFKILWTSPLKIFLAL